MMLFDLLKDIALYIKVRNIAKRNIYVCRVFYMKAILKGENETIPSFVQTQKLIKDL